MKFLLSFLIIFSFIRSLANPITTGDQSFLQMNYADAITHYQADQKNPEAQWKMARAYICLADISPLDKQKPLYYKAVEAAKQCIRLNDKDSNGHTWLGAALGNIANYEGSRSKVRLCTVIKQELDRALSLNPKDDIALSILGSFYRALGNTTWLERSLANTFLGSLPKGGFSESESAFKQAIQLSPGTLRHWFELGRLYQDWGKKEMASKTFQSAQRLPVLLASDKNRQHNIESFLAVQ